MRRIVSTILGGLLLVAPGAVQAQFSYATNFDNTLTIIGYSGPGGAVTFPTTNINGWRVTGIGDGDSSVFSADNVTSITIPGSITSIHYGAFAYSSSLLNATIANGVTNIGNFAFSLCSSLTNLIIPGSVASVGDYAFEACYDLTRVYFTGNAPGVDELGTLFLDDPVTVYYLPHTIGWGQFSTATNFSLVLWNPLIQTSGAGFGVSSNQFGFNITGTSNISVVVEACTNLASPVWIPLTSVTLGNGPSHISDPQWTNYSKRFYRLRSP